MTKPKELHEGDRAVVVKESPEHGFSKGDVVVVLRNAESPGGEETWVDCVIEGGTYSQLMERDELRKLPKKKVNK